MAHDIAALQQAARGQWPSVYADLLGWDASTIERLSARKPGPCPSCGGTDRFNPLDTFREDGGVLCRHCFRGGDGIAALQHFGGWSFTEALDKLCEYLGQSVDIRANGNSRHVNGTTPATRPAKASGKAKQIWPTLQAAAKSFRARGEPSAIYHYVNSSGDAAGAVLRWDTAQGEKTILPIARFADGWQCCAMPEPRPIYSLSRLLTSEVVYVVEGEQCSDALSELGLAATCSAGGANAAKKTDWSTLKGKHVYILPDSDEPGEKYASDVIDAVGKVAKSVKVVRLTHPEGETPKGYDVFNWIDDQRSLNGLSDGELVSEFKRLVNVEKPLEAAKPLEENQQRAPKTRQANLAPMSQFAPRKIDWAWYGRIARGCVTLLAGRPGNGKSFISADIASRVSTGTDWPDGSSSPLGDVLLMAAEDDPSFTIRPRLDACGADVNRVFVLQGGMAVDGDKKTEWHINIADVDIIRDALDRLPDCALIVVDPIGSFLGGKTDAHRDNEVRGMLTPLADLARERNIAVLLVCHTRKSAGNNLGNAPLDDGVLGSVAFAGLARNVWHVVRDEQGRGFLRPGKSNLCRPAEPLGFAITGEPAAVEWRTLGESEIAELEAPPEKTKPGPEAEALGEAIDWLRGQLANGPLTRREIEERLKDEPFGLTTIRRAKAALGVTAQREGRDSFWRLPDDLGQPGQDDP